MNVFAYGTLKRGHANDWLMERVGAKYLGPASISGFTLIGLGGGVCPGMVSRRDGVVVGEVYDVHSSMLAHLDFFETSAYTRIKVRTELNGKSIMVFAYLFAGRVPNGYPVGEQVGDKFISVWKGR